MVTKKIKDRTVKDIFEKLLGNENAKNVLTKIQKEYDNGIRGESLEDFAKRTIDEIIDLKTESVKLAVAVTTVSIPHQPKTETLKI
jgi:hypothetical protein